MGDADATCAELAERGVPLINGPIDRPGERVPPASPTRADTSGRSRRILIGSPVRMAEKLRVDLLARGDPAPTEAPNRTGPKRLGRTPPERRAPRRLLARDSRRSPALGTRRGLDQRAERVEDDAGPTEIRLAPSEARSATYAEPCRRSHSRADPPMRSAVGCDRGSSARRRTTHLPPPPGRPEGARWYCRYRRAHVGDSRPGR